MGLQRRAFLIRPWLELLYKVVAAGLTSFAATFSASTIPSYPKWSTVPTLPLPNSNSSTACSTPSALAISTKLHRSSRGIIHISRCPRSLSCPMRPRPNSSRRSGRCSFHWPNLKCVPNTNSPSSPRPIPINLSTCSTRRLKDQERWLSRFVSSRRSVSYFQTITYHVTVDVLVHSPQWRYVRIR